MTLFFLLLLVIVGVALVLGGGVGLGFLVNWLFPYIDIGSASVVGTIAIVGTILILVQLFTAFGQSRVLDEDEDYDDRMLMRQMEMFVERPSRRTPRRRKKR